MTTLREAATQALEALERYGGVDQRACDAEEALRAALAEPENWELRRLSEELERCKQTCAATSEAWREEAALGCDHCNHPLYAAIKCRVCGRVTEPVQEPVAWRWGYRSVTTGEMDWRGYVDMAAHPNLRSPEIIMEPLYSAPSKRKPLSEDEALDIARTFGAQPWPPGSCVAFARAIERAHGIGVDK